jgi:hypothetical protein
METLKQNPIAEKPKNGVTEESKIGNTENNNELEVEKTRKRLANTSTIQTSHDLRALLQNLNEVGDITGSSGHVYKKEYLIGIISHLKGSNDEEGLQMITNTYGLRDKVKKLLLKKESNI